MRSYYSLSFLYLITPGSPLFSQGHNPFHYYISYFSAKPTLFKNGEKEKRNRKKKKTNQQRSLFFLLIKNLPSGQCNLEADLLLYTLISLFPTRAKTPLCPPNPQAKLRHLKSFWTPLENSAALYLQARPGLFWGQHQLLV